MKLTYRGISFDSLIAGVPSMETGITGTFLGRPYSMKHAQIVRRQFPAELTYRGVRYSR